jgi:GntR family transcriptional regulator of arabinose operon
MAKKYQEIQAEFEKMIRSKKLAPGERLPTEEEICAKYSVSRSTAGRALNELSKKKLVTRHTRKGTIVNILGYNKNGVFCIIVPSLKKEGVRLFAEKFTSAVAAEKRTAVLIAADTEDMERLGECIRAMNQINCAGIAIHPTASAAYHPGTLAVATSSDSPVVVYYRSLAGFNGVEVIVDEEQCAALAVNHLVGMGHRRLAFAGVGVDSVSNALRYKGFCEACARAGIDCNQFPVMVFQDPFQIPNLKNYFCNNGAPTALVAISEYHAFLAYDILTSLGLKIPEDVAIAALDGSSMSAASEVPFTAVEFPAEELGGETARKMLKINSGEISPDSHIVQKLPGRLVIRNSCGSKKARRHEYMQEYLPLPYKNLGNLNTEN